MRINHNIGSMIAQGAVYKANNRMNTSLERLSTGLRINRASDDPTALLISENLRTQVRGLGMAKQNAQDGIAILQVAEGAAAEISDIMQRMRELSIEASNDTLTTTQRTYTDTEYQQLTSEIDRVVNTTTFNQMKLLDGANTSFGGASSTASVLHIGPNSSTVGNQMTVSINTLTTASLGLNVTGSAITTQSAASSALVSIDAAIQTINGTRSKIGSYVNRLEHAISNIMSVEQNTQAADSTIRDADFAKETAEFTRNSILVQSGLAMIAQANMAPQGVLSLLGR